MAAGEGATVGAAVASLERAFREAGLDSPGLDARQLVAAAAVLTREAIAARPESPIAAASAARLAEFRRRRLDREPVSRILGRRAFYGREFEITLATLDPRPETETIVDAVLAAVSEERWDRRPLRILDIGTGTGCIAATLLAELPEAMAVATDLSMAALEVAARNAAALGVSDRLTLEPRRGAGGLRGPFDVLVSNPPYIPAAEIEHLDPEVKCYDPKLALDGGRDGLAIYREIASNVGEIVPEGWIVLEVGAGQAEAVANLLVEGVGEPRVRTIRLLNDLAGHQRCVALRTQS